MFCFLLGYVSKLCCSSCLCYDLSEYCTSRAVPNIQSSGYLNTLGAKLLPGIDVMWTGRFGHNGNVCYKNKIKVNHRYGYNELCTRFQLDCHQQLQWKLISWVTVRTHTIRNITFCKGIWTTDLFAADCSLMVHHNKLECLANRLDWLLHQECWCSSNVSKFEYSFSSIWYLLNPYGLKCIVLHWAIIFFFF